jgi:hypothetical protein
MVFFHRYVSWPEGRSRAQFSWRTHIRWSKSWFPLSREQPIVYPIFHPLTTVAGVAQSLLWPWCGGMSSARPSGGTGFGGGTHRTPTTTPCLRWLVCPYIVWTSKSHPLNHQFNSQSLTWGHSQHFLIKSWAQAWDTTSSAPSRSAATGAPRCTPKPPCHRAASAGHVAGAAATGCTWGFGDVSLISKNGELNNSNWDWMSATIGI